ncbi:MAG TPA: hypothetical protein VFX89_19060 [Gammaproteobacteria bacterium]|nr:hypothetical protein [Gammaproteobacteria bacterium]
MPWNSASAVAADARALAAELATESSAEDVPAIDDLVSPIDELAFVLAADHLTTSEKVRVLQQWRYDELLVQNGATEGLGCERADGRLFQQISRALLRLEGRRH